MFRQNELVDFLIELEQFILKRRELEEVVVFCNRLCYAAAIGTWIAGFGIVDVQFVVHAVMAGVRSLVNVAVIQAALKKVLNHLCMLRAGRSLEEVDIQIQRFPLIAKLG